MCQPVKICLEEETYDYLTNTCKMNIPDFSNFPITSTDNNSTLTSDTNQLKIPTINCVNGLMIKNSTICICYTGWTDDNSNLNISLINKCNKIIQNFNNQTQLTNNNTNNSIPTNSSNIIVIDNNTVTNELPEIYKLIIISSCIITICCFCFFFFCYRCKKLKKEKENVINNENFSSRKLSENKTNNNDINYTQSIIPVIGYPNKISNMVSSNGGFLNTNRELFNSRNNFNYDYYNTAPHEVIEVENPERVNRKLKYFTPTKRRFNSAERINNKPNINIRYNTDMNYYEDNSYYNNEDIFSEDSENYEEEIYYQNSNPHNIIRVNTSDNFTIPNHSFGNNNKNYQYKTPNKRRGSYDYSMSSNRIQSENNIPNRMRYHSSKRIINTPIKTFMRVRKS